MKMTSPQKVAQELQGTSAAWIVKQPYNFLCSFQATVYTLCSSHQTQYATPQTPHTDDPHLIPHLSVENVALHDHVKKLDHIIASQRVHSLPMAWLFENSNTSCMRQRERSFFCPGYRYVLRDQDTTWPAAYETERRGHDKQQFIYIEFQVWSLKVRSQVVYVRCGGIFYVWGGSRECVRAVSFHAFWFNCSAVTLKVVSTGVPVPSVSGRPCSPWWIWLGRPCLFWIQVLSQACDLWAPSSIRYPCSSWSSQSNSIWSRVWSCVPHGQSEGSGMLCVR